MSKIKELEGQLEQLRNILQRHGIFALPATAESDKDRADYIEFGSGEHMALLGLAEVEPGDETYITHKGKNGKIYRLVDEVTSFMHYHDPAQAAALTLRQKVSELEAGKPPVPGYAEAPLWTPEPVHGETWQQVTA